MGTTPAGIEFNSRRTSGEEINEGSVLIFGVSGACYAQTQNLAPCFMSAFKCDDVGMLYVV